ncbi:MAG: hypothetical protein AAGK97_00800 [Bacteroidota bacterium]
MAKQDWTIRGTLRVRNTIDIIRETFGEFSPLAGVTVKVQVRSKVLTGWGTWATWGKLETNSNGFFSITKRKGSDRRQFRFKILLDDEDLRVKEGGSFSTNNDGFPIEVHGLDLTDKDWFEIFDDKDTGTERKAGLHNLGNIDISAGRTRRLCEIWNLYQRAIDVMDDFGSRFKFKDKLVIKYPMNIGAISYANPVNHHVYISNSYDSDSRFVRASSVLLHELMHIWSYDYSKGEFGMAYQLAKHQDVHQGMRGDNSTRENTEFVPFMEGFAEWASIKLAREICNRNVIMDASVYDDGPHKPLSRAHISAPFRASERNYQNMDYSERGWYSFFNILCFKRLGHCDFNSNGTFAEPNLSGINLRSKRIALSFKDVLEVFLKNSSAGLNDVLKKTEMNFDSFLNRAKKIHDVLDDEKIDEIKTYLDPNSTTNPNDLSTGDLKQKYTIRTGPIRRFVRK